MALRKLQEAVFQKKYSELTQQCPIPLPNRNDPDNFLLISTINRRTSIYQKITSEKSDKNAILKIQRIEYQQVLDACKGTISQYILLIYDLSMSYFTFELSDLAQENTREQKKLRYLLQGLPTMTAFARMGRQFQMIRRSLFLSISYIQLQTKRLVCRKEVPQIEEIEGLERFIRGVIDQYNFTHHYCRKLFTILAHLKIHSCNLGATRAQLLSRLASIVIEDSKFPYSLLSLDTKIVVVYNCVKNLVGLGGSEGAEGSLIALQSALGMREVKKYEEHVLHLFFIVKGLIFRKGEVMESSREEGGGLSEEDEEVVGEDQYMAEKFSIFLCVNLDETLVSLDEVARSVIRHRVASLATVIGFKFGLDRFSLLFLELMHDSPFNNDIQTIKLCFQLFETRQFSKLQNLFNVVLSAVSCKNLKERQVLLCMCGIFTGLYLQNQQQALLYAKLNHKQDKKIILREQTLLQHVGFAYYNLATHQIYRNQREGFLEKALDNLLRSYKINPFNYIVQYCIGKIYMKLYNYEEAYKYAMECCKSNRGEWIPFTLLACVYYCQRKISKATLLVDQLLKKYPSTKVLHYIRAYLEVNKHLLEVEHDEQTEAARELGEQVYEMCRDKLLKTKPISSLLHYCQNYYQLSLGKVVTESDDGFFTRTNIFSDDLLVYEGYNVDSGYHEGQAEKSLLQIIELLIEAGLVTLSQGIVRILPPSPNKNYFKAVLHQLKKEKVQAIAEYRNVLVQQPYHTPSLINLALIEEDTSSALHCLELAEKFTRGQKLSLVKGMLLSRLGQYKQAHEEFLKEGQIGWMQLQPDLIYYY